jgi:dienelactone hydrolase
MLTVTQRYALLPALFAIAMGTHSAVGWAEEAAFTQMPIGASFQATDSLQIGDEPSADARQCLDGLCWKAQEFTVDCQPPVDSLGDALVTFPSPVPTGNALNDRVVLEWHVARDASGQPLRAPAVVVVHESGSRMTVGRLFAQGLRPLGVHTFMIHLPQYGLRREGSKRPDGAVFLTLVRQAIADVRRARDAVAALPLVDTRHIALQGTSLGGIISATTAGLDRGYDSVFLMLAGGDLHDILEHGQRDAARFRDELTRAGITGDKLLDIARQVEPTRLAHRADPGRVWMYTADYDQVVPRKSSDRLSDALRLEQSHCVHLAADHYTGVIFLPFILEQIAGHVRTQAAATAP